MTGTVLEMKVQSLGAAGQNIPAGWSSPISGVCSRTEVKNQRLLRNFSSSSSSSSPWDLCPYWTSVEPQRNRVSEQVLPESPLHSVHDVETEENPLNHRKQHLQKEERPPQLNVTLKCFSLKEQEVASSS